MSDDERKDREVGAKPTTCNPETLQKDEWLSGTVYYKVVKKHEDVDSHAVVDNFGNTLSVSNNILGREMTSSRQYDEEKKVTRTEMVNVLSDARDTVFTVKFKKQLTGKRLREVLDEEDYEHQNSTNKNRILNKIVKGGEDRTLVGFMKHCEPFMGRSAVFDLEAEGGFAERQVDHRTIEELILKRVRYTLK